MLCWNASVAAQQAAAPQAGERRLQLFLQPHAELHLPLIIQGQTTFWDGTGPRITFEHKTSEGAGFGLALEAQLPADLRVAVSGARAGFRRRTSTLKHTDFPRLFPSMPRSPDPRAWSDGPQPPGVELVTVQLSVGKWFQPGGFLIPFGFALAPGLVRLGYDEEGGDAYPDSTVWQGSVAFRVESEGRLSERFWLRGTIQLRRVYWEAELAQAYGRAILGPMSNPADEQMTPTNAWLMSAGLAYRLR